MVARAAAQSAVNDRKSPKNSGVATMASGNGLAELLRTGATPVMRAYGFKRDKNHYYRFNDTGDEMVVCFGNAIGAPPGTPYGPATEIGAGYFPRYFLEDLRTRFNGKNQAPDFTMALFYWRVVAPAKVSYAPGAGQPWGDWWALGERTADSSRALARILAEDVLPRLTRLEPLEAQCAAAGNTGPEAFTFHGNWGGPVYARLGRAPRAEVEATLDSIPINSTNEEFLTPFIERIRNRLDSIYPHQADALGGPAGSAGC